LIAYTDLLRSVGRNQEAARQEKVIAATQALFEAQGASVDLEIALFEADRGRPESALRAARSAWQNERGVQAADAMGWALHVNGRDQAALRYAEMASRLGTKSALFAYHRGMIEMSIGNVDAAQRSLRGALDLNPHFSPLLAPRAESALESLGSR
jgi:tetratricopeptide (TPR) repeat protein